MHIRKHFLKNLPLNQRHGKAYVAAVVTLTGLGSCLAATPAAAAAPDIVFQVAVPDCTKLDPNTLTALQGNLTSVLADASQKFPQVFMNPNSQNICANQKETIGIWFAGGGTVADLNGIDVLSPHEALMAVHLSAAAAQTATNDEWKHIQSTISGGYSFGAADIAYDDKKKTVQTTFHVEKETVKATFNLTDTISLTSQGFPNCSEVVSYGYNSNLLTGLAAFFAPFIANISLINYIDLKGSEGIDQVQGVTDPGIGCAFAQILPTTILTPRQTGVEPGKLVFSFRSVSLSPTDGMTFFTQNLSDVPQSPVPRAPGLFPEAPFQTYVYKSAVSAAHISARLKVGSRDLRAPVTVTWTAATKAPPPGKIVSTADEGTYALATFNGLPAAQRYVGARTTLGSVTIHATDVDGVSTTASFPVTAIVENDPAGPPPKNVGKLVPKGY